MVKVLANAGRTWRFDPRFQDDLLEEEMANPLQYSAGESMDRKSLGAAVMGSFLPQGCTEDTEVSFLLWGGEAAEEA